MECLDFMARVVSHIPDKGQVTVRYYRLYANAHRGKVKKTSLEIFPLPIIEEELRPIPAQGLVEMIRRGHVLNSLESSSCPHIFSPFTAAVRCASYLSSPIMPWWTESPITSS
jgi:hypothetical protein